MINIQIGLMSARNSQMETFWKPKYLDSQPCITPNEPASIELKLDSLGKSKKETRRTKIEREIIFSVSHLIRKKLKTEDIILENSSESFVDHIQEKVSLETRSELLDVSGKYLKTALVVSFSNS